MSQFTKKMQETELHMKEIDDDEINIFLLNEILQTQHQIEKHLNSIKSIIVFCFALSVIGGVVVALTMFV